MGKLTPHFSLCMYARFLSLCTVLSHTHRSVLVLVMMLVLFICFAQLNNIHKPASSKTVNIEAGFVCAVCVSDVVVHLVISLTVA